MALTIKISRSDRQWTAEVPKAKGLVAWSPSLKRLRKHVDVALREFYPELASQERREVIAVSLASALLLSAAVFLLYKARSLSVPASLLEMTGKGWECIGLKETSGYSRLPNVEVRNGTPFPWMKS